MNFSIVIPTWNRSKLLDALLESLYRERNRYQQGETEVLVVDSSRGSEKESIQNSCKNYDAQYIEGDDSVRKKRNLGIRVSKYDYILFIDSDVTCREGLLDEYVEAYRKNSFVNLGGILGYTEFVGEKTFWWKILELTSLVSSFSFAKEYPFHSWTIGNNVSFKKSVLEEIGMFQENFPFKLGGDDLEMTYRVTKAGYMIGSAPEAYTYHSRETWNNAKAIHNRAKRWGTMEYHIAQIHPELYKPVIPRNYVIETAVLLFSIILSLIMKNPAMAICACVWIVMNWIYQYGVTMKKKGFINPIHYIGAQIVQSMYEFYRVKHPLTKGSLAGFFNGMVYNSYQIRFGMKDDAKRMWQLGLTYVTAYLLTFILL
ncbi:MAG: glycosyltransferase [Schaedlerella sp.]|nr:glycosyltransferase [Schaedlerella sp.]